MVSLPEFPKFSPILDSNVGPRWSTWESRFEQLLWALDITDDTRRRALLMHYAGPEVNDIFDTLAATGDNAAYDTAKQKLEEHFETQTNKIFEIYQFRLCRQETSD